MRKLAPNRLSLPDLFYGKVPMDSPQDSILTDYHIDYRGAFLFATIGITASDFFCPNLATVADRLGMAESTAGVTFLAFG